MSRLRKATSFASLRRDKDRSPTTDSLQQFDSAHPLPSPGRRTRNQHSEPSSPVERKHRDPQTHVFPSIDHLDDDDANLLSYPAAQYRSNLRPSNLPPLRFSGSSSQTYIESPLSTPVDYSYKESLDHYPAIVAVETMDALVDGMNGVMDNPSSIRSPRFIIPHHHPLYQPPLPTPPPGVVLGGRKTRVDSESSNSGDDDEKTVLMRSATRSRRRRPPRPSAPRNESDETVKQPRARQQLTPDTPCATPTLPKYSPKPPPKSSPRHRPHTAPRSRSTTGLSTSSAPTPDPSKSVAPSISDIIRNHTSAQSSIRPGTSRSSSLHSLGFYRNAVVMEEPEEPSAIDDDLVSRSSVDSIADEVQRTIRNQKSLHVTPQSSVSRNASYRRRHSAISEGGISVSSPQSEGKGGSSIYSMSINQEPLSPGLSSLPRPTVSEAIAQYLRSSKLTTLLKLTRSPHASPDNPLTVSLSDLGNPDGFPLVVFLGLGCVRHVMGLYDEMAQCLNLRLITIDRWGLGRTEPRSKSAKGITQWAAVVEEVLDQLHIHKCSVMAHSAGAPYALSFANTLPDRICGDVCLLAPWVGGRDGAGGYKWLKYVPNGLLKTAQAAEWKLQAWMIGRPPTLSYQGIGYNAASPVPQPKLTSLSTLTPTRRNMGSIYPSYGDNKPRPSLASSNFSEYDDLRDFDGRFDSRSTVGVGGSTPYDQDKGANSESKLYVTRKKSSRGFLGILRGGTTVSTPSTPDEKGGRKRLKALRSMGSLKDKPSNGTYSKSLTPQIPQTSLDFHDLSFDLDSLNAQRQDLDFLSSNKADLHKDPPAMNRRAGGRRSLSLHHSSSPKRVSPLPSPNPSTLDHSTVDTGSEYQAALGNALIAASHAESAKGTHSDLLQILNHENHSWGFSYSAYPHKVRIWYGEKDEKIAENAVRWMEKTMGESRCSVNVVKGADHGLMYKSSVVVEVLERVSDFWRNGAGRSLST